jgi:putative regulator of septum formation
MQPAADRGVDPDGPATDAASTPTDGSAADSIDGWTPPPWTAGPDTQADWTPPPWTAGPDAPAGRYIPTGWWRLDGFQIVGLIVAALLLVGGVVGGNINASRSTTGGPKVAPAGPTQVHTGVATPDEIDESEYLNWDGTINMNDSVDLRVGDCFDLKHPLAEIENVRKVPCSAEHDYELFHVGAMRKHSHSTEDAILDYVIEYCEPAFGAYIGKAYDDSELDYDWLVPTEDAWRSGDRTVHCAAYDPNNSLLNGSLRGAHR